MQNTFIKWIKKLYKIFSLPAELVHMSLQFISSHNIEKCKICSLSSFIRKPGLDMKNSITHRYYFRWCPRSKFHQPVYSSHYILQNAWMSNFNKHTLCYNIETSTICAISAYTLFSFSESVDISRCDFKTEMLIYIFKWLQLCPLIPVGPYFNKSSAVIKWQNADFALYCLFWESSGNVY